MEFKLGFIEIEIETKIVYENDNKVLIKKVIGMTTSFILALIYIVLLPSDT